MITGKLYRNSKMTDVDFYVTAVTRYSILGFWISRGSKNLLSPKVDSFDIDNLNLADWTEINE